MLTSTSSEGGFFKALLKFPHEYPQLPPKMKFVSEMWHPNSMLSHALLPFRGTHIDYSVYPNGDVCISILHPPEEDKYGYESAAERWLPIHTVETILVSVISMLSSPNDSSPANLDAAVRFSLTLITKLRRPLTRAHRKTGARTRRSSRRRSSGQSASRRRTCRLKCY